MKALFAGLFAAITLLPAAAAEDDSIADQPYPLRIVVVLGEHRMLTPAFRTELQTGLRDQVQLAFGKLAKVDVKSSHPLISDINKKGLQVALEGWADLSTYQTFFVMIDFADNHYDVQVGQHDGSTGLANPVIFQDKTSNRQQVVQAAAALVLKSFRPAGVVHAADGSDVQVALQGGRLAKDFKQWVKAGDVFAVARLVQETDRIRAVRLEWALLQVTAAPDKGIVKCKYAHRYLEDELKLDGTALGYHCVLLPTTKGQIRLRVVNDKTQEYLSVQIHVSSDGSFKGKPQGATVDGFFKSNQAYSNVAYVRILSGGSKLAQFPVEILDDRVVVVHLNPDVKAVERGQLEQKRDRWVRWLYEALSVAEQRFADLNPLLTLQTLEQAVDYAQKSHKAMATEIDRLDNERSELRSASVKWSPPLDLHEGDQLMDALRKTQKQLHVELTKLEKTLKEKNSDETRALEAMLQQAELMETQAEYEKAIQLYQTVHKAKPEAASVKTYLTQLQAAWQLKGPMHAQAREFIYSTWPNLDLAGVRANLDKAKQMLKRCGEAADLLTPRKLELVNKKHGTALFKRLDTLKRAPDTEDNRAEYKAMLQLTTDLIAFQKQVTASLNKK